MEALRLEDALQRMTAFGEQTGQLIMANASGIDEVDKKVNAIGDLAGGATALIESVDFPVALMNDAFRAGAFAAMREEQVGLTPGEGIE